MKRPLPATALAALFAVITAFTAGAQQAPFIGIITQDKVEVRSGAGRAYYVVGGLESGDMVRVEKVLFNNTWYQVRVPKGVHSYVSKAFVDAQGEGSTGKINADRTEFKAASLRGPGESYRVQGMLKQGDTVQILAEEGNFYKIASPKDAYVFIAAGTLREATAADLNAAGSDTEKPKPEPKPEPEPIADDPDPIVEPVQPVPPVQPEPEPIVEPQPVVEPQPDPDPKPEPQSDPEPKPLVPGEEGWPDRPDVEIDTPARSNALKALEKKVLPYFSLPVTKQPLDKMADAYSSLKAAGELPRIDEQIIDVRLRLIDRRKQIIATIERAKAAKNTDLATTVVPDEKDLQPIPTRYTAVGVLKTSSVYNGQSLPLLYRLTDAGTSGRTIAYVAPSKEINIATMLDQLIGVVGDTKYDRALRLNVIEITRAVPLEAEQPEAAGNNAEKASEEAE